MSFPMNFPTGYYSHIEIVVNVIVVNFFSFLVITRNAAIRLGPSWIHESSRVPGASYTAPGPEFQGGDLKNWNSKIRRGAKPQGV